MAWMPVPTSLHPRLRIDAGPLTERLVAFLRESVGRRFGYERVVLGLSGGVDSAVVAALCARAFGGQRVHALRLPYRDLGAGGLELAAGLIETLGLRSETVDITEMVDAYSSGQPTMNWHRRGNIQARCRAAIVFDKMKEYGALPVGTSNRTEILFGYFTQGGDDLPPVNPIGDLYKTQVWQLAEYLDLPGEIVTRPPSAGLEPDQTDEGDFGFTYQEADLVLTHIEGGFGDREIRELGIEQGTIDAVRDRVRRAHHKRLPTLIPAVQPVPGDPMLFFRPG